MLLMLVLLNFFCESNSAKILGMFPTPSHSHQIVFQPVWRELSLRGHQVTVFTPNPLNDSSLTNLTEIDMSSTYKILTGYKVVEIVNKERYTLNAAMWFLIKLEEITEEHFKIAQTMFKDKESEFDLVIVETLHPLSYGLGCKFRVPFVGMASLVLMFQTHDAVGNPTHPIIGPDMFFNAMEPFSMYKKIASLLYNWWYRIFYYGYILPKADKLAKKYWGEDCPYLGDLERNVSLILVNTNPIVHPVRPNVPNIIEMGQMHINVARPLPQDLQNYLDGSTNGVVYFNLGSNVRIIDLKPSVRKIILDVLSELPYNVLCKWENDSFPNKPTNMLVRKWFPQQDILRHKNVKVFITQGGLQSMEEAIINAVPMVAIPFIVDQPLNVMKMVQTGIGRGINYVHMTKEELKQAIIDVSENNMYRENIKQMSKIFSDQPWTGLEKAVWWIEYVLRHNGARHLRSPAADMSWFEYYLLDVFALILVVFVFFYFTVCYLKVILRSKKHTGKVKLK